MRIIGHIKTDFKEKFGIPRQSGIVRHVPGEIIFEKEFRVAEAFRGLEDFSHIWILWKFSETERDDWSPTVRPPLLGGNKRVGVFATRSPFRPNPIGLSCVKLDKIEFRKDVGPVLLVSGVDILDGTPIYDIKPYLPYADSRPEAFGGFTENLEERKVEVLIDTQSFYDIPAGKQEEIISILSNDPRPSYQKGGREYGMRYGNYNISFVVEDNILSVRNVEGVME